MEKLNHLGFVKMEVLVTHSRDRIVKLSSHGLAKLVDGMLDNRK